MWKNYSLQIHTWKSIGKFNFQKPIMYIMQKILLTSISLNFCIGIDDSFFEDGNNDLSGFKVYRAYPTNRSQTILMEKLQESAKVFFLFNWLNSSTKLFSFMTSGVILISWLYLDMKSSLNLFLLNMESNGALILIMFNIL